MNNDGKLINETITNTIIKLNFKTHANILNIPILAGLKTINTKKENVILLAKDNVLIEQVLSDGNLLNDTFEERINKIINETEKYINENIIKNNKTVFKYYKDYSNNSFNYKLYSQTIILNNNERIINQLNAFFVEKKYNDIYQISLATLPIELKEGKENIQDINNQNNKIFLSLFENLKLILDNLEYKTNTDNFWDKRNIVKRTQNIRRVNRYIRKKYGIKLKEANKKIENAVVTGYQKIEDTVIGGYKKIEDTVVSGYKKVEDKFVDEFLRKDNETIEEAKERVKKEQEELKKKNEEIIKNGGK